jgi:hypothetical protein
MKFGIKNIGPIHDCSIVLNRLTVLCGQNNTGKWIKSGHCRSIGGRLKELSVGSFDGMQGSLLKIILCVCDRQL